MGKIAGGCFGMMIGCGLVLVLALFFTVVGIYWWINPEAREKGLDAAEMTWQEIRHTIDGSFERADKLKKEYPKEPSLPTEPVETPDLYIVPQE